MTLFPVVLPVIEAVHDLSGKEQVARLSGLAREALKVSAEKTRVKLGELLKDESGSPCPVSGHHWSLSHKPECVAAVVSRDRVGIDVEEMKPRTGTLFSYLASDDEWGLKEKSWNTFFRYWTAKEATLKVIGIGICGLKTCRIVSVPDETHIVLDYKGDSFLVEQLTYKNHIVAVVKGDNEIEWVVLSESQIPSANS